MFEMDDGISCQKIVLIWNQTINIHLYNHTFKYMNLSCTYNV